MLGYPQDGKMNNFLKLEIDYIRPSFDLITIELIRTKPNPNPSSSY